MRYSHERQSNGKGSKLNLKKEQMTEILNIFGRNVGKTIEEGLVHHTLDFGLN